MNRSLELIVEALRKHGADACTIDGCRAVFELEMEFSFKRGMVLGIQQVEDVINQAQADIKQDGGR